MIFRKGNLIVNNDFVIIITKVAFLSAVFSPVEGSNAINYASRWGLIRGRGHLFGGTGLFEDVGYKIGTSKDESLLITKMMLVASVQQMSKVAKRLHKTLHRPEENRVKKEKKRRAGGREGGRKKRAKIKGKSRRKEGNGGKV